MSNRLAKEFRPLLLPACVAIIGSAVRPSNDIAAVLGSLACFGGFAMLAAMSFGLEFQQRTLSLLLSQPAERSRLWQHKLLVVFLAGVVVALLNWRVQELISQLPALLLILVWMFLLATVCSSGFWIETTDSTFLGLVCCVLNQVLVFGGFGLAIGDRHGFTITFPATEILITIFFATLLYSTLFLWLGRRFWTGTFVAVGIGILIFLLLCGLSQLLSNVFGGWATSPAEACLGAIFLLATACSTSFWTLIARTTIGGAALSVASQFLVGLAILFAFSRIYEADPNIQQPRFLAPVGIISILYCAVFLWLGWRKFARLELSEASAGENLVQSTGFLYHGRWSPTGLRCRADQNTLNLVRKELRLQRPLLMLAGIFLICWLAAYFLQLLQPDKGYANLKDLLICLYAPVALLLAGCISLGDEKVLGLTAWHLALPISARTQWLVKLVVAALTGATLGLLFPLCLYLISAVTSGGGWLEESKGEAWIVIASISGGLFLLSFWAATLLTSTVRAALSAVAVLVALLCCCWFGAWCAQHFLETIVAPASGELIVELSDTIGVLSPRATALLLTSVLAVATVLLQSFRQFRRIQLPAAVLVKAPLALAGVFVLLGVLLGSTEHVISVGG